MRVGRVQAATGPTGHGCADGTSDSVRSDRCSTGSLLPKSQFLLQRIDRCGLVYFLADLGLFAGSAVKVTGLSGHGCVVLDRRVILVERPYQLFFGAPVDSLAHVGKVCVTVDRLRSVRLIVTVKSYLSQEPSCYRSLR